MITTKDQEEDQQARTKATSRTRSTTTTTTSKNQDQQSKIEYGTQLHHRVEAVPERGIDAVIVGATLSPHR
jgi:hypothetical protein